MGITGACTEEESFVKGPSSRVTFDTQSITNGCTFANLSIVREAWFVAPPPDPSLSFEFEEKPANGIVLNHKSAVVGVLRGDGSVLTFSDLTNLRSFFICLRVSENTTAISSKYPIVDFGYSEQLIGKIYPLGVAGSIQPQLVFDSLFWCASIDNATVPKNGNNIHLYPIQRVEDYEDSEEDYTSRKTRALMYTLGVCYCINFVLLAFYLINFLRWTKKSPMLGAISTLLLLVCVFRICFMFMYPNGKFADNELAEFVVFEIPTFLLFSVVIISIYFWKKLSSRKKFFSGDTSRLKFLIILGLVFVWSLWVIVTIVFSEVILEEDGSSPCPGRVAPSYDKQEEDTRTLTIIYQSLVISVTLVLALVFFYYSSHLLSISKNVSRSKRFVLVIGGVIVVSFFIRSLLFLILLAADFISSVYMFITLMITEVLMIFFLQLQFNSQSFRSILGGTSTGSTVAGGGSTSPQSVYMDD